MSLFQQYTLSLKNDKDIICHKEFHGQIIQILFLCDELFHFAYICKET